MPTALSPFARRLSAAVAVVVTATAMGLAFAGSASAASPAWKLLGMTGPTHLAPFSSEQQALTVSAIFGTFTLTFDGDTTAPLPLDATAADVEAALNALPSISAGGGSVSVRSWVPGGTALPLGWSANQGAMVVSFDGGPLATEDVPLLQGAALAGTVSVQEAPAGIVEVVAVNVGREGTNGSPVTVDLDLPEGIRAIATAECAVAGQHVACSRVPSAVVTPGTALKTFAVPVIVEQDAPPVSEASAVVQGGGAPATAPYAIPVTVSSAPAEAGIAAMWAAAFDEDGAPYTVAGGHPASAGAAFWVNTILTSNGQVVPAGDIRDLNIGLPAGFIGNPTVTPRCDHDLFQCPAGVAVGRVTTAIQNWTGQFGDGGGNNPLNSIDPADRGYAAQFNFDIFLARASAFADLRQEDYGVDLSAPNIPTTYRVFGAISMLDGVPPGSSGAAFLTNPTECTGQSLPTSMVMNSWQFPDVFSEPVSDEAPAVTGCSAVPFEPVSSLVASSSQRDGASGLEFDLELAQEGLLDPNAIATSHLRDVVVDLPEGVAVNPSGATGLQSCSDGQMAIGESSAPTCPDGSKLGTVRVTSPLVDREIGGTMYLGRPKSTDPMSGEMLRLWVVARNDDLGIMVKLPGSATADPETGKLTATFRNNPRVPFDHLEVKLRGGDRGLLALPQTCGDREIATTFSPWSGNDPVAQGSPLAVGGNCDLAFAPSMRAGGSTGTARGSGSFSFVFSREDGEQWLRSVAAELPEGLLASVGDVPLCSSGQAAAGACAADSRIGSVDATAGSGTPFVLEEKGSVFLTEGYKGCAYGLLVSVPVIAGPFDGKAPETDLGSINVRQAVCVDPVTAEVSAISDPLPTIWHGIPIRTRSVIVSVDRPGFMLNPSGCATKQIAGTFGSDRGATVDRTTPFGVSGCSRLPFKPNLTLALTGRRQVKTGKHPGIKAQVTQAGVSEAGIDKAVVRLPKSLALDPNNAQALCEFADGTKPDLENHCPKGSIVGRARAKSPLLKNDLAGNVYFVKNIRTDPTTGNQIRTLPMIIVALRGEVAINLKGESDTTKSGKLVNTFANVPDAPISKFNLNIKGGRNGILAVTRTRRAKINLCAGRHVAEADLNAQNQRVQDTNIRMKTPCTRRAVKKAKRAAKKAARKARNARS